MAEFVDFVAEDFHSLVAEAQANELRELEKAREEERHKMAELRAGQGLNSSELLQELYGQDPEKQLAKLQEEDVRIQREAAEAVASKEKANEQLPADRFPAPVITSG